MTTLGKGAGELWNWDGRDFLFHKTVVFLFKFSKIMEYPVNVEEYIESVWQQCIEDANPLPY